jgi:hypothetical protein
MVNVKAKIEFIGFAPGLAPFGGEQIFAVGNVAFSRVGVRSLGITIPPEVENQVQVALHDWNNRGLCDDHVYPLFRAA